MKPILLLIKDNGGVIAEESDLDKPENSDAIVVSFGPINDEILAFLDQHQHEIYSPNLIFEAMGREELCLDERLIFVDRYFHAQAKSQLVFARKPTIGFLAEPYKFHFINYECSDITLNLMEFAKKVVLVRSYMADSSFERMKSETSFSLNRKMVEFLLMKANWICLKIWIQSLLILGP